MKRRLVAGILGAALMMVAGLALAAEKRASEAPASRPAAVTKYTFGDDYVVGTMAGSDYMIVTSKASARHPTLIRVRTNFVDHMVRTEHDL